MEGGELNFLDLDYSGWKLLSEEWGENNSFFDSIYFLYGFDMSSNMYLIKGRDGLTLIDGGNDYTAFIQLRVIGYSHMDIRRVILTHGHREHVMGVIELLRYPPHLRNSSFEVYMHEASPEELKSILKDFGIPVKFIRHGDKLDFFDGFELEVIHTPGHTFDSLCFFERSTKTLFSGDTVLPFAYASCDETAGGREDYHLLSLRMLAFLEPENLLPGHGPLVFKRAGDIIRANRLAGVKKIVGEYVPWSEIAVSLARKGWLDEAILACNVAIDEDRDNISLKGLKASLLNDSGRFEEALKIFEELLTIDSSPFLLLGKAVSLMGLGDLKKARDILEELRKLYPGVRDIDVYYGILLVLEGDVDAATKIPGFKMELAKAFEKVLKESSEGKSKS
ncbi:MAG: MBL fold metallo-hydrolase [Thermosulfidibacteraceae bacterium]